MRNRKPNSTNLFAHREDEAFQLIFDLEALFARMFPSRGSRWLRARMHAASARLAQLIIVAAGEDDLNELGINVKPALMMCKIVNGMLKLLERYNVLNCREHDLAIKLAVRLTKVIAKRFFGIESDDNDDGSSSPPTTSVSVSTTSPNSASGAAAEGPPIFS